MSFANRWRGGRFFQDKATLRARRRSIFATCCPRSTVLRSHCAPEPSSQVLDFTGRKPLKFGAGNGFLRPWKPFSGRFCVLLVVPNRGLIPALSGRRQLANSGGWGV